MWFLQIPSFTVLQFLVFLIYNSVLILAVNSPNPNSLTDYNDNNIVSSVPWIWRLVLAFGRINTIAAIITCLITSLNIIVYKLRQIQEANLQEALYGISFLPSEKVCRRFTLDEIKSSTNDFDEALVIGQGGFGKVYKGIIDNGTVTVAIKRLNPHSKQGPHEFETEINLLSQFRHSHIISLIGYCRSSSEMILVYEYMVNGTLSDHLYKSSKNGNNCKKVTCLSWDERLKICIGAGRGLDYLHTGTGVRTRIIQRDVKSDNILLDEDWTAKISDFGLAKIGPANQSGSHVSTNVKGTFGYLDPEYFLTHRLTRKADVYAFGVVLFQVLCGRRAVDSKLGEQQKSLARWAQRCVKEGTVELLIDPCLKSQILPDSLKEFVRIAEQCLHSHPKKRPTMAEVVAVLESSLELQVKIDSTLLEWDIFNSGPFGNEDIIGSSGEHLEGINDNIIKLSKSNNEKSPVKTNRKFTAFGKMWVSLFGSSDHATSANGVVKTSKNSNTDMKKGSVHQVTPTFKLFTYAELQTATRNFSSSVQIGDHDSQYDFIGWIDENLYEPSKVGVGMAVTVKNFDLESFQEINLLQSAVELFGRLKHPNLVSTLGYCLKDKKVFLVYEYMQNGSLEKWLFNNDKKPLSWDTRVKIAIGVARGLTFLLNEQIIYCSVGTSIILLDEDFNAKLSNFKQTNLSTISSCYSLLDSYTPSLLSGDVDNHVYEAPESLLNGDMNEKTDAYRFGVLLLEIMTGRHATDAIRPRTDEISVNWARTHLQNEQKVRKAIDPRLDEKYPVESAYNMALLIQECLCITPRCRPSMEQVLRSLEYIINWR